jgi:hypothetical protein
MRLDKAARRPKFVQQQRHLFEEITMDPNPSRRGWLFGIFTAGLAFWLTPRPRAVRPGVKRPPAAAAPFVVKAETCVTGGCCTFVYDASGTVRPKENDGGSMFDYNGLG